MTKLDQNKYLFIFFILSTIFMELIFKLYISENIMNLGLLFSLFFSISLTTLFYIICTSFSSKINYFLTSLIIGLLSTVFYSQFIYYKFFKTFYTFFSLGNGFQVFQFWKDILAIVIQNIIWLILFYIPFVFILIWGKKLFSFQKINKSSRSSLLFFVIILHIMTLEFVYISGTEENSAYDLYFHSYYPNLSVEKLGLMTTMRIDFQRLITDWSPTLKVSANDLNNTSSEKKSDSLEDINNDVKENPTIDSNPNNVNEQKEDEVTVEYNISDIDFDYLIENEDNENILKMHEYFNSVMPTKKNDYTGKYKDYNLIFITAEGFSTYAVDKEITPTLYKLVHEGFNFTNFYNPLWGVSTTDGEYVACTSLIPKSGVWSFYLSGRNYMPFTMGNQLKKLDYKTVAYHNHSYDYYRRDISHPNMGYEYKGVGNGLDIKVTWPESDLEMMEKTIPEYINDQPFHAYYMTVSGHMQYNFIGNYIAIKNKEYVEDLPYSDACKAYLTTQIELDRALEYLINQLEEAGVLDKTLIALSPDHYPYGLEYDEINELAGHEVERNFELYKSTFILYTKNMDPITIEKPCSSLDIIPTLSNLLGLEYDSRLLMGKDIFSDSQPLVIFLNKSFITDKGRYNSVTKEFIPNEDIEVDEDYVNMISSIINNKFFYSAKILETDYYGRIFEK